MHEGTVVRCDRVVACERSEARVGRTTTQYVLACGRRTVLAAGRKQELLSFFLFWRMRSRRQGESSLKSFHFIASFVNGGGVLAWVNAGRLTKLARWVSGLTMGIVWCGVTYVFENMGRFWLGKCRCFRGLICVALPD